MTLSPPVRRPRRVLRALSSVLIVAGLLLIADAATTLLWQEPVSAMYTRLQQGQLADQLVELEQAPLEPVERRALEQIEEPRQRLAFRARVLERKTEPGDPIGRIVLPTIGVSEVVVHGTATGDLRKGPGHYPDTPLPGEHGTVAIAGHRTTYGAPFRRLDELDRGDRIELAMPYGRFTYSVERTQVVASNALWVTDRADHDRLVLTACHPLYSAAQRIVAFARLESSRAR